MKQKRRLFDELMEGVDAMRQQRAGKITLRSHEVEVLPPLEVDAELIRDTRERMHVSRAVFARCLRVSTRTLRELGARANTAQCPGRCREKDRMREYEIRHLPLFDPLTPALLCPLGAP